MACATRDPLEAVDDGQPVEVVDIDGLTLVVEPVHVTRDRSPNKETT